jgi:hypothetical protein
MLFVCKPGWLTNNPTFRVSELKIWSKGRGLLKIPPVILVSPSNIDFDSSFLVAA